MAIKSVELVCMANYCRSPVAEKILESLNLENISFSSSGIRPYPSASMDKRSYEYISNLGISNKSHIPRKITSEIVQATDLVLAMDAENHSILLEMAGGLMPHIRMFSDYLDDNWPSDVPDPYYGEEDGFDQVLDMLEEGCPVILQTLMGEGIFDGMFEEEQ